MTRSERVYRALLRAYPAPTRDACADDMAQLFTDRLRDAGSARATAAVWVEAIRDVAATAPREHVAVRGRRRLVEGPEVEPARVPMKRDVALASIPLVASLAVVIARPFGSLFGPVYANPPGMFGLPLGMAILVLLAVPASVGLLAVRRNRELNDPWHQALFLAVMLVPVPVLALVKGAGAAAAYALAGTLFLLAARFRRLMLALSIPLLLWLIIGPFVMAIVVPILEGLGEAS